MPKKYDVIIIGAGIVGLSVGYKLIRNNSSLKVLILEKEKEVALHQTGNNSGVIHSGIYYKPGSAKATNCKIGYRLLLDFCDRHDIEYELCGKIIVATKENQLKGLQEIYSRGISNGLIGLKELNEQEIKEKESNCSGIKAIWVPQAGIIDYKKVAKKYLELFLKSGGEISFNQKVNSIIQNKDGLTIITNNKEYSTHFEVNCAGLYSDKIANLVSKSTDYKIIPFRGEYYELSKQRRDLVNGLIYPVPDPDFPFLGVHLTKMINGGIEAGPNAVLAFAREGYKKSDINISELFETLAFRGFRKLAFKYWKQGMYEMYRSFSKKAFVKSLQELVPEIQSEDLIKGSAGVRAQACYSNGSLIDDFYILDHGRSTNVCNAPSPAATSSLAIGETIAKILLNKIKV